MLIYCIKCAKIMTRNKSKDDGSASHEEPGEGGVHDDADVKLTSSPLTRY